MKSITRVTYFRHDSQWCYAAWDNDGFDHSGTLDMLTYNDDRRTARAWLVQMFAGAVIERVEDC